MAFENSEYVNLRFENSIDDSVVAKQYLSHVVAPELRDPLPGARVTSGVSRALAEARNPPRRSWLVTSDCNDESAADRNERAASIEAS